MVKRPKIRRAALLISPDFGLDIWSQRQRNVRQVTRGMLIGRLLLTSALEVLKGHSSASRQ